MYCCASRSTLFSNRCSIMGLYLRTYHVTWALPGPVSSASALHTLDWSTPLPQGTLASSQGATITSIIPLMRRVGMPPGWSAGESSDSGADCSGHGHGRHATTLVKNTRGSTSPTHALLSNVRPRIWMLIFGLCYGRKTRRSTLPTGNALSGFVSVFERTLEAMHS